MALTGFELTSHSTVGRAGYPLNHPGDGPPENYLQNCDSSAKPIGQIAIVTLFGAILSGIPLSGSNPYYFYNRFIIFAFYNNNNNNNKLLLLLLLYVAFDRG